MMRINEFAFLCFHADNTACQMVWLPICAADRMGPDDLLIRINEDLVLAWLSAKVERATKRFAELASMGAEESRWSGRSAGGERNGGFAENFQAISAPIDASRQREVEAECKQHALEAVCEYLSDEWATKLAEKFRYLRPYVRGVKHVVRFVFFSSVGAIFIFFPGGVWFQQFSGSSGWCCFRRSAGAYNRV